MTLQPAALTSEQLAAVPGNLSPFCAPVPEATLSLGVAALVRAAQAWSGAG